ncbi:ankyrin repeat domain-containing protein [Breznakiella homolactica]|uniref:Ankyrin repeat domain-containing protein n=1 Tax=Breznakiella homolactica TaxID=2798577 RepID=A0A7T8B8X1_9SPIR|nr:ankyrin repeat domain-containing protein [Breznakiella homolactica]QQO07847.1 ankyrin repeat domain-containing protein [Breznakiella homolactica]
MSAVTFDPLGRLIGDPDAIFRGLNPGYGKPQIAEVDAYNYMGVPPLLEAIYDNDTAAVSELLEKGAWPNVISAGSLTALDAAASSGNIELVKILIAAGADVTKGAPYYYAKDEEMRGFLKEAGADAGAGRKTTSISILYPAQGEAIEAVIAKEKETGEMTGSILMSVILGRSRERIEELVAAGKDINETSELLYTPLVQVFEQRRWGLLECLLKAGADPNLKTEHRSPLSQAIDKGEKETLLLLEYGAFKDKSPYEFIRAIKKGYLNAVPVMQEKGADLNGPDRHGELPVFAALGNTAMLKLLLDAGADPDVAGNDHNGCRLIHAAVCKGDAEVVLMLLKAGADSNAQDSRGRTALHNAVMNNDFEIAELLLDHGAKKSIKDENGKTPLDMARQSGFYNIADRLEETGAE